MSERNVTGGTNPGMVLAGSATGERVAFDPAKAAQELRNAIVNEAPRLYAENQRLWALLLEASDLLARSETYLTRRVSGWANLRGKLSAAIKKPKL